MNLYLTLIGIISTISSILIIICLNSKYSRSLPSDGSKSPLESNGLSQSQKSQLLLIVCVIFFMSLVTTNVKTSKFTVIFNDLISVSEDSPQKTAIDLGQVFYGNNKDCQFTPNANKPHKLFSYLKQNQIEEKFIDLLISKNLLGYLASQNSIDRLSNQSVNLIPQLLVINSNRANLGAQLTLPVFCSKVCKQTKEHVPTLYVSLKELIESEEKLMQYFRMDSYNTFKQSICKLNGVEIKKEVQKIGNYIIQTEIYSQISHPQNVGHYPYIVIDNFEYLQEVLIFNKNLIFTEYSSDPKPAQTAQNTVRSPTLSLASQYQLFIDKLINDLIPNCKINVILHTSKHQSLTKFYSYWKNFKQNIRLLNPKKAEDKKGDKFPFQIKSWEGITKRQFYRLVKQMIDGSSELKDRQSLIWRDFEIYFGELSVSSHKLSLEENDLNILVDSNKQVSMSEIEDFLRKIFSESSNKNDQQVRILKRSSKQSQFKRIIADHYGLANSYKTITTLIDSKDSISLTTIKRKLPFDEIRELEKLNLVLIKSGKVFLTQ